MVDMKNDLRVKLMQEALDEYEMDIDEINKNPALNPDNADWIGGVEVIATRRAMAQIKAYKKFYTEIKRIATADDELEDNEETWTGFRLIDTSEDAFGNEIEIFKCGCGRTHSVQSGGDIACCPCEFENEGESVNTFESTERF